MLCSVLNQVIQLVSVFVYVYSLIVILFILSSWITLPYTVGVNRVRRFLFDACDPYLRLFRRIVPAFGSFDLSPIVALLALNVAGIVVTSILARF